MDTAERLLLAGPARLDHLPSVCGRHVAVRAVVQPRRQLHDLRHARLAAGRPGFVPAEAGLEQRQIGGVSYRHWGSRHSFSGGRARNCSAAFGVSKISSVETSIRISAMMTASSHQIADGIRCLMDTPHRWHLMEPGASSWPHTLQFFMMLH